MYFKIIYIDKMPEITSPTPLLSTSATSPIQPSKLGKLFMECVNDVRSKIPESSSNESEEILHKFILNENVINLIYDELSKEYVKQEKTSEQEQLESIVGKDVYEYISNVKHRQSNSSYNNRLSSLSIKLPPATPNSSTFI